MARKIVILIVMITVSILYETGCTSKVESNAVSKKQTSKDIVTQFEKKTNRELFRQAAWSVPHTGGPECDKMTKELFINFSGDGSFDVETSIVANGGVENYKKNISRYLKSKDPVARYFSILALAIINDKAYIEDIAAVLKHNSSPDDNSLSGIDTGFALIALAMFDAQQYIKDAEKMAKSENMILQKYASQALYIFTESKYKRIYKNRNLSLTPLNNEEEIRKRIIKQAERMNEHLLNGDINKVMTDIDPVSLRLMGGSKRVEEILILELPDMKEKIDSIKVRTVSSLAYDGKENIFGFIVMETKFKKDLKKKPNIYISIAYSEDSGKKWFITRYIKNNEIHNSRFKLLLDNVAIPNIDQN